MLWIILQKFCITSTSRFLPSDHYFPVSIVISSIETVSKLDLCWYTYIWKSWKIIIIIVRMVDFSQKCTWYHINHHLEYYVWYRISCLTVCTYCGWINDTGIITNITYLYHSCRTPWQININRFRSEFCF